ncbi:hypothetical protein [Thermoactinospora rubra]|uniref:hypothetical protein n=1 Tax=Thermoactinospora rubra TaxID=1088767 RepID=UPI00197F2CF1|nr:hypothetical protein [Thermoactinospora rubra]
MSGSMRIAREVADAVLYEGYLLYPYRASAAKNQARWQFGVLVPPAYTATAEHPSCQTECLLEAARAEEAVVRIEVRFLQVRARTVERAEAGGHRPVPVLEVAGRSYLTYDEAVERVRDTAVTLGEALAAEKTYDVGCQAARSVEPLTGPRGEPVGRIVRDSRRLDAVLRVRAEPVAGPYGLVKLRVRVENTTEWADPDASRDDALRCSLIGAHTLLSVEAGAFVSLLDPPAWAAAAASECVNVRTWPVLAGEPGRRDVMLSAPIILYDYPSIAQESPGDLFDATEIDELLSLRTLALTEAEKREARATDPRAAEIIDRVDDLPPEVLERLHGRVRPACRADPPWWDPGADRSVSPGTDSVVVDGVTVARGSSVRLLPGRGTSRARRADAHDMFLAGRTATVEAVFLDVDGACHLAVTLDDDPGADLQREQGRFLYFAPDEVEPLPGGREGG